MTQKELLYFEDAIGHEKSIISILNESIKNMDDDNLINFLSMEIEKHENLKENLISLVRGKANE